MPDADILTVQKPASEDDEADAGAWVVVKAAVAPIPPMPAVPAAALSHAGVLLRAGKETWEALMHVSSANAIDRNPKASVPIFEHFRGSLCCRGL